MADENSKKLVMDRRKFMTSSMGLATCFLATNKSTETTGSVDEAEAFVPALESSAASTARY